MNKRMLWSRVLLLPGIVVIALGFNDPYDGPVEKRMVVLCVLSGIGLVALSAFLGKIRHRAYVYGALGVGAVGLSARIVTWISSGWHPGLAWAESVHLAWFFGVCASLVGAAIVLFEFLCAWMVGFLGLAVMVWALESTVAGGWRYISESGLGALGVYLARSRCRALLYVVSSLLLPLVKEWWVGEGPSLAFIVQGLFMLAGSGLAALGAYRAKSRYRRFLYVALSLTACGLTMLFLMARFNPPSKATQWWEIFYVTYPIGAILSLVGAILIVVESLRRTAVPKHGTEAT
ncbi:MAG: hypothetical protein ACYDH4_08595 [Candidatus Cryosericum sp.]